MISSWESICKLCEKSKTNQTGSHIFTSSLITSRINQPQKGRDKELMFGFGRVSYILKSI